MSHSPVSLRTDVVKALVKHECSDLTEVEQRRLEMTVLQVLAPIYAPQHVATTVDKSLIFRIAIAAMATIDERERASSTPKYTPPLIKPVPLRPGAAPPRQ